MNQRERERERERMVVSERDCETEPQASKRASERASERTKGTKELDAHKEVASEAHAH